MTLTQLSAYLRRFLPFILVGFLAILIIFYAVRIAIIVIQSRQTNIEINATFGKIKPLALPQASSTKGLTFDIDTIEGEPVTATLSAQVYFLPPARARLGYREKIYLVARSFGIDTATVDYALKGTIATFKDIRQTLSVDIASFNFTYDYDFRSDTGLFDTTAVPTREGAQEYAIQFLQSIDKYPDELAQGKTNTIYMYFNPENYSIAVLDDTTAVGSASPNLIEVDFYRPDMPALPSDIPVVSSSYFNSQNFVLLKYDGSQYKVLRAQVKFFERSPEQVGTYPLKTGAQAYTDLQEGRGILISKSKGNSKNVTIKEMFLAYFDPLEYEEYLRPVYVFLGDNNFVGYVDAISPEYLTQ